MRTGARASQALFGQIASLERTARLHGVLKDPKLLELYRTQDERLSTTREQLHRLATGDARRVVTDAEARYYGAMLDERSIVPVDGEEVTIYPTTFSEWMVTHMPSGSP